MKNLFQGYYRLSDDEVNKLWDEACFIFDTNVLLEAYALPETAREEFFSVLEKVAERVWIPYQVALEFHRRRYSKIRDTSKGIAEMRAIVKGAPAGISSDMERLDFDKWNTGIHDLPSILKQLDDAYLRLDVALAAVESKLPSISLDDPIAARVSNLFTGRVGAPPESQKHLDELVKDGTHRYASKIPPGFSDHKKGDTYVDKNIVYEAKFGDLIMWRQIVSHAKAAQLSYVIFVTADIKEDWWYSEKSGERLGPQPALVQEFLSETAAQGFWMYTPDRFLENARTRLDVAVADETVEQVKQGAVDVVQTWKDYFEDGVNHGITSNTSSQSFQSLEFEAKQNLRAWVAAKHPNSTLSSGLGVDIAVEQGNQLTDAYHVARVHQLGILGPKLATIQRFAGTRHHAIIVFEPFLTRKLALEDRTITNEYQAIMERCGIVSMSFFEVNDSGMTFLGDVKLIP